MKILQSLSTLGNAMDLFDDAFGWYAPEYHLMSWALSCMQLRKFYPNVGLAADTAAARVLIGELGLPYTELDTFHEEVHLPHPQLWALPKIHTYARQQAPFLHVDGDVFVFEAFPLQLMAHPLVAQNPEVATEYYTSMQRQLLEAGFRLPACVQADFQHGQPIQAVNAGILGGSDMDFFREYTTLAQRYVSDNIHRLSRIDVQKFNVFFEQHLFYALAKSRQAEVGYLFETVFEDNKYKGLGNFWETPAPARYLHLIGGYKRNQFYCAQMAFKLRAMYPELYYRIIQLVKRKGVRLKLNYYHNLEGGELGTYLHFFHQGVRDYSAGSASEPSPACFREEKNDLYQRMKAYAGKFITEHQFVCRNEHHEVVNRAELSDDLQGFLGDLQRLLERFSGFPRTYLYGKDLQYAHWYVRAFSNTVPTTGKLVKCPEAGVVESRFNWGNCFQRVLAEEPPAPSEEMIFKQEKYYSLVVAEAYEGGFSISEVDDLQVLLLGLIEEPLTLAEIAERVGDYFDEEVVLHHREELNELVLLQLKHLLLSKAIMPVD